MERRRILVVAAALIAVLGVVLVLVYVKGSDKRAQDQYATVPVLKATAAIAQGETYSDASASGKLKVVDVVSTDKVNGAESDMNGIQGSEVAEAPIYPGEQILPQSWSAPTVAKETTVNPGLAIPNGDVAISVSLTDPGRVAGFVEPGSSVAIFATGTQMTANNQANGGAVRVLLPKVLVLAVGSTAPSDVQADSGATQAPAETLPNTLLTLAVSQQEAEKILLASGSTGTSYTLSLGLLNDKSKISMGSVVDSTNLFTK
jgi:pilus assembly protein CpaB